MVNNEQFSEWLRTAKQGEKICYFTGDYLSGRSIGRVVFKAYENGEISLFQSRQQGKFNYWAQKRNV